MRAFTPTAIVSFVVSGLVLSSCGDDGGEQAEGMTEGSEDGTHSSGPATDGPSSATDDSNDSASDDADSSSDGPLPPTEGVLAGDISIDQIEINQGTGIPLAEDGVLLPAPGRPAPVISGRGALVRASYELGPEFSPRPIIGRLWLRSAEGDVVYADERMVSGPSDWTDIDGTFHWVVDPEDITADAEVRVQLLELDEDGEPSGDISGSQFPAEGFEALEAWGDPMVMHLMLVPFTCDGYDDLDLDPADLADFEAFIFNTYPVQELVFTVHDPVHSPSCSEFDAAEIDLPALREADGADPWVYYGGLLPGDGAGYSISIDGGDQMDYRRTFANHTWRGYGLTFDLFGHELGHNHGRDHTFEDGSYPNDNSDFCGSIEAYGWGPRSALMPSSGWGNDLDLGLEWFDPHQTLLPPTDASCSGLPDGNRWNFNDMMSYEYPYWVSAHTYAAAAERIRLISTWSESAEAPAEPGGRTLRVVFGPEGDIHRMSAPGTHPIERADAWATCRSSEGDSRRPVRRTTSLREGLGRDGRFETFTYEGYELPLEDGLEFEDCRLEVPGLRVPFVVR